MENDQKNHVEFITLTTATKNAKVILHFYLEEVGMNFWYARLFKKNILKFNYNKKFFSSNRMSGQNGVFKESIKHIQFCD